MSWEASNEDGSGWIRDQRTCWPGRERVRGGNGQKVDDGGGMDDGQEVDDGYGSFERGRVGWEIRKLSRPYARYWNAFINGSWHPFRSIASSENKRNVCAHWNTDVK